MSDSERPEDRTPAGATADESGPEADPGAGDKASADRTGEARELREIAELAARPDRAEDLLDRSLDALAEVMDFDLATYLELEDGVLSVRSARGPRADRRLVGLQFPLSGRPAMRRVIESRRARLLDPRRVDADSRHHFGGTVRLPEDHSCLMVPVVAGEHDLGILVLDAFEQGRYGHDALATATLYGVLIGLGLAAAAQAVRLEEYRERLTEHNRLLEEESGTEADAARALERAESKPMRRVIEMARQVAVTDAPVLIAGETGTGKEVLARAIHAWSRRAREPFVALHCAALPRDLIESELFGHKRGAFSGAVTDRQGRFRVADGGTLLLDEIGDLPEEIQVSLLRVLQEGTFHPVGSDCTVRVDVRLIAATHVDLERAIEAGRFREDLYYRLNVFPLNLPPLRDRLDDLPSLTESILEGIRRRAGGGPWTISERAMAQMRRYDWPGNIRELVNALERARVLKPEGGRLEIEVGEVASRIQERFEGDEAEAEWPTLAEHELAYLQRLLERTGGKVYGDDGAARIAGMPPSTLQSRLRKHGIQGRKRTRRPPRSPG